MSTRTGAPGVVTLGVLTAAAIALAVPTLGAASPSATSAQALPVAPMSFDAPLDVPMDPPGDMPTTDELSGLLYSLADPGVSAFAKGGLVEGGIGPGQAVIVDRAFGNANRDGYLPLTFAVSNVQITGPGLASATVTISGPRTSPSNTQINFVDQSGWKISRSSAMQLMSKASGR